MNVDSRVYQVLTLNFRQRMKNGKLSPNKFAKCQVTLLGKDIPINDFASYLSTITGHGELAIVITDNWENDFKYGGKEYSYQAYLAVLLQTLGFITPSTTHVFVIDSRSEEIIDHLVAYAEEIENAYVAYDDSLSFCSKEDNDEIKIIPLLDLEKTMRIAIPNRQKARSMPVYVGNRALCSKSSIAVNDKILASGLLSSLSAVVGHSQFDSHTAELFELLTVGNEKIDPQLAKRIHDIRLASYKYESTIHAVDELTMFRFLPYPNYAVVGNDIRGWLELAGVTSGLRQKVDAYRTLWEYALQDYDYDLKLLMKRVTSPERDGMAEIRQAAATCGMDVLIDSYKRGIPINDIIA